ncbi:MAG: NAD-dependent epimerase/dehydratase family protein [Halioglobus sp.]|nr:NAD-dependent epimerase/dehydratase family protein [Halioglobus sp.]
MKVLIFGGGGFIGSAVADRLLAEGHSLRIFERPRVQPYRDFTDMEDVEWAAGDISSMHDVSDAIQGVDAVLHMVSTTLPKSSNDDPIFDVQSNVVGSLHILNAMVTHCVPSIVFISSGGTVYGNPLYLPVDENHPTNPVVSYGITKLAIEKYLQVYERLYGIKAITLRVANPYGERQRLETAQGAVGVFLHHAIKGVPIEIWGDGSVTRDYIHVSDVAEAFSSALDYSGEQRLFNVSSGIGTSLNDLITEIEDVLGQSIERHYLPGRPFDVPANVLCNELARSELKWTPRVSMKKGINQTAEWMRRELARSAG